MTTFTRDNGLTVFRTGLTDWHVRDQPVVHPDGTVTPAGVVSRVIHDGIVLVNARALPTVSANDPACGGLAYVGWHHLREHDGTDPWNHGGDMHPRRLGWGVASSVCTVMPHVRDGAIFAAYTSTFRDNDSSVGSVGHRYRFDSAGMRVWTTMRMVAPARGPALFVKEPKVTVGTCAPYETITVSTDDHRTLTTVDLTALTDPARRTVQIPQDKRAALTFRGRGGVPAFRVVAGGAAMPGGARETWEGGAGFDAWARVANEQTPYRATGNAYCKQGPDASLSRKWEVAKRGGHPHVQVMMHAWEGGTGFPDCLNCFVPWLPGKSFTACLSASAF